MCLLQPVDMLVHNKCGGVGILYVTTHTASSATYSGDYVTFLCERCSFYAFLFPNDTVDDNISDRPLVFLPSNTEDEGRCSHGTHYLHMSSMAV